MKLRLPSTTALLQISAGLTLVALGLMVWSMVVPTPLPVMLAMTVGQGIGTLAFGIYGFVVIRDIRRSMRAKRASIPPPVSNRSPSLRGGE
jgi:hypothetical protein